MKKALVCIVMLFSTVSFAAVPLVFVHLGRSIPEYYKISFAHTALSNPDSPIYFIAQGEVIDYIRKTKMFRDDIHIIDADKLPRSEDRTALIQSHKFRKKYWRYTLERFFVLSEFMKHTGIEELFHVEGDNLIYVDLQEHMDSFRSLYRGIGMPLLNDYECVPGFVYINNRAALEHFTAYALDHLFDKGHISDMRLFAKFLHDSGELAPMPGVPPSYTAKETMVSEIGRIASAPELYSFGSDVFHALFDPAPIGQLIDGRSHVHDDYGRSHINPVAAYDTRKLSVVWKKNGKGRKVPHLCYEGEEWPLIQLHIHSKNLEKFAWYE